MQELRKSGIDVLGEIPWGSHFSYFYQTTHDLLDTLVPYFMAGLRKQRVLSLDSLELRTYNGGRSQRRVATSYA